MKQKVRFSAAILLMAIMTVSCEENATISPSPDDPVLSESNALAKPANGENHRGNSDMAGKNFRAHLDGSGEVPAVETQAQGQTTIKISKDETSLHFKLIAANIENITQAHIHCGSADVNGPVVVFLFPDSPPATLIDGRFDGVLADGERTGANVIPRPDSDACPGGVANFDELLSKIRNGEAYVNVHTSQNPPGEIRGQLF